MTVASWTAIIVAYSLVLIVSTWLAHRLGWQSCYQNSDYRISIERGVQKQVLITISEEVVRTIDPKLPDEEVSKRARQMLQVATPPNGVSPSISGLGKNLARTQSENTSVSS